MEIGVVSSSIRHQNNIKYAQKRKQKVLSKMYHTRNNKSEIRSNVVIMAGKTNKKCFPYIYFYI
jgi:hypothetical protein